MFRLLSISTLLAAAWSACLIAAEPNDVRLTLPPIGYAVVGSKLNVYFDDLVLFEKPEELKYVVASDFGDSHADRWTITPDASDVGMHHWRIEVFRGNQPIRQHEMTWMVSPAKCTDDRDVSLLIVGDSLTHATIYPNDLAKRLLGSGLPRFKMLGTHRPKNADPGVAHEGYGGWTWERFASFYEPNPDPAQHKYSSPFVFLEDGKPKLDVAKYIRDSCGGRAPDFVIFLLGINDCFAANPDDPAALDQHIDRVLQHAETLLKAFREAAPNADLGVCLTTPGNVREEAFRANYQDKYPRWGWKRIQHRLVERELKQFSDRSSDHIFVIPTELSLDPTGGYPADNAVHPNTAGYQEIAAAMHAWLMSRLHAHHQ